MRKKLKDTDEIEFLAALTQNRLKTVKNVAKEMEVAKQAAEGYLKKNARINIRISKPDLARLKRRAAEHGIPYQTLIASVLHQFVTGQLAG